MKKVILAAAIILSAMFIPVTPARADVNDFTIDKFEADYTLSRTDPQGTLKVSEKISVTFTDQNHGILRAIPGSYKGHPLQLRIDGISSDTSAPTPKTTYDSNGNIVIKIGDPDRTVTGFQQYTINYTVNNVIGFYDGYDELYWDVNGDQWKQPFTEVIVRLRLPEGLRQYGIPLCYTGSYGSTSKDCSITYQKNIIEAKTTMPLSSNQTLTFVAGFEKGYFRPHAVADTFGEYWKHIVGLVLPVLGLGGGSALLWRRSGRDAKGRGIIVPQFEAPDNLKPMAVGALTDFKVDNRDITATIIDLAVRGYIEIIETKKNKLIGKDKLEYKLKLINPDFAALDAEEKKLLTALFNSLHVGSEADISKSKNKLYNTATSIKKDIKDQLKDQEYFRRGPFTLKIWTRKKWWMFITAVFIVVIFVLAQDTSVQIITAIGCLIGGLIALPFLLSLDARTLKGVAAKEHIQGLKLYLGTAQKDRLEMMQGPDARYAANAGEPVRTVELFEKLLPYAMVLGVEKKWSKQFEELYTSPPDWYSGNWTTFSAYSLTSSLGSGVGSAVNTAFTAPGSSGGSGFSGSGGSSGGGGGGGGGGGW